jgi:hypothetical protein
LLHRPPQSGQLGRALEGILLRYKEHERQKTVALISVQNRQAVVAAGIYNDPVPYLNEATSNYSDLVYLNVGDESKSTSNLKSNQELFEEWKRLFGKMEDDTSSNP